LWFIQGLIYTAFWFIQDLVYTGLSKPLNKPES
jgi:hypothetical protein